jgi:hypothetical protein
MTKTKTLIIVHNYILLINPITKECNTIFQYSLDHGEKTR